MSKLSEPLFFYITWWLQGLSYLLPERIRSLFAVDTDELIVHIKNNIVTTQLVKNHGAENIEERSFDIDVQTERQSLTEWVSNIKSQHKTKTIYRLKRSEVLHKTLSLPASAKDTLRQILGFEMDRSTPFKLTDVYFDYYLHNERDQQNRLQVELYVVKKSLIDTVIETMDAIPLKLDAISLWRNDDPYKLNFIPSEQRAQPKASRIPLTSVLVFLLLLSLSAAVYIPIAQKENQLAELQQSINHYRQEALEVQTLKSKKQALLDRTQKLVEKYSSQVPAIIVLNELTTQIPDTTWINRLIIKGNELHLHGESENATELVPLLESTPIFTKVQFQSTTTINKATQKEQFQLLMLLNGSK